MSSVSEQPRQPAGTAAAGQWAENPDAIGNAPVDLGELTDEEYNADGTFHYPPEPRSARQHLLFWMRVPVPDTVLQNVQNAYAQLREQEVAPVRNQAARDYEIHAKDLVKQGITREAYIASRVGPVEDRAPMSIGPNTVRTIVRAERAFAQKSRLRDEEQARLVSEHKVHVGDFNRELTLAECREIYNLKRLNAYMKDPNLNVPNTMLEMRNALNALLSEQQGSNAEARDEWLRTNPYR